MEQDALKSRLESLKDGLLTKEEALEQIKPFENCAEAVISGKTIVMEDPDKDQHFVMRNQGKEYSVNEAAFAKASRLIGIPETYVRKVPSELLFPHLAYWLDDGGKALKAFVRPNGGDRPSVVGFAKEDAYYYPLSRVIQQMDKVSEEYYFEGLEHVSWRNTTFGLVFPQFEFGIKDTVEKGDWLYGGIKVRMSLLGEFPTKISAFLLTLACLNGMVSANEIVTYNRKFGLDGQDVWMVDSLEKSLGALTAEVDRVQALTTMAVDNEHVTRYLNHVFNEMGVNQKSRLAILDQIIQKQPQSLYELMNVITSVAHTIENREEVYNLQALGGYLVQHSESCGSCHRPL